MDHLLPHYERELALLRRSMGTFAAQYPKIAVRLGITGEHSEDPHIERMLQSFALLAANIDSRLDDHYPEFSDAILGILYPQYGRPLPACTIAEFDVANMFDKLTESTVIPRGTELLSKIEGYRFRTVYDVTLSPLRISNVRFASTTVVPSDVVLPPGTTGVLSITFVVVRPGVLIEAIPGPVRVHVSGSDEIASAAMDTMSMRATVAFVEDHERRWTALNESPLVMAGYGDTERLIYEDEGPPPLRLLTEYFAYRKKFDFVDVDFAVLARFAGVDRQFTLHLAISGVHPDSWTAQRLKMLSAEHLKLFCTPIVNLSRVNAVSMNRDAATGTYPVKSKNTDTAGAEVWSVDAVRATPGTSKANVIHPFTSILHGSASRTAGPYWTLTRRDAASSTGKKEVALSLVALDGQDVAESGIEKLVVDITCSNGDRPCSMRIGNAEGDLMNEQGAMVSRIAMLAAPTEVKHLPCEGDAAWRFIAQTAPHSIELSRVGLVELKRLFRQFAGQSAKQAALVDGLVNLGHRVKRLWLPGKPMPSFVTGLEVTLTIDEASFAAASLSTFIVVMDHFFSLYVPTTSFVQLVVLSASLGREIQRCAPRAGVIPVV